LKRKRITFNNCNKFMMHIVGKEIYLRFGH
jgi:hypothetical protein